MIKILHIVSSLNINAGMMSVIMNYYRNIDRSKIQFDFCYLRDMIDNHKAEIEQLGGRTFFMPCLTFKPSHQKRIRQFFTEHIGEYTAVHCHPIWSSAVIAREAKNSGIKHIIQHVHSTKYSDKKKSALRNKILIKFIRWFATDYIACNTEASYLFGKKIAESGQVYIFPNAIDTAKYLFDAESRDKMRKELGISKTVFVVGSVGRLSAEKNQLFILEIFKKIRDMLHDSKLILVGGGNMQLQIEKKIVELNLCEDVIMTGKRKDIQALLSSFDLFLMPSIFEGTPVSAIEALTNGLPCVLSDTITKSIDMKGVKYIPLSSSATEWANNCIKIANQKENLNRCDYSEVVSHGFDIKTEAVKLQNYYLDLK